MPTKSAYSYYTSEIWDSNRIFSNDDKFENVIIEPPSDLECDDLTLDQELLLELRAAGL